MGVFEGVFSGYVGFGLSRGRIVCSGYVCLYC